MLKLYGTGKTFINHAKELFKSINSISNWFELRKLFISICRINKLVNLRKLIIDAMSLDKYLIYMPALNEFWSFLTESYERILAAFLR